MTIERPANKPNAAATVVLGIVSAVVAYGCLQMEQGTAATIIVAAWVVGFAIKGRL